MKTIIKIEEATMFAFSIYLFAQTEYVWWWYLILILTPDIGMLGYLVNTKVGAILYNFFHHKGIALIILIFGYTSDLSTWILVGIILFGHSSLDRIFDYGLKYPDSFKHTHLGWISQQ